MCWFAGRTMAKMRRTRLRLAYTMTRRPTVHASHWMIRTRSSMVATLSHATAASPVCRLFESVGPASWGHRKGEGGTAVQSFPCQEAVAAAYEPISVLSTIDPPLSVTSHHVSSLPDFWSGLSKPLACFPSIYDLATGSMALLLDTWLMAFKLLLIDG